MTNETDPPLESMDAQGWWRAWRSCNEDREALERELAAINSGERVVVPKNEAHARAMMAVALGYLKGHQ